MKPANESSVQFADEVYHKAVSCDKAYYDALIVEVFIDGLLHSIRSGICTFWGHKLRALLRDPHKALTPYQISRMDKRMT